MMMLMLRRKMLTLRTRMLRRKTVEARTQTYSLCEPAQWKCTSTCHKSHTIRKFTGKNAADQSEHPDQAPAFTSTVRTPQCGLTVWGTNRQTATACKRVTSGLLDLSLARAPGHNPIHGHTGTTPIHGHTETRGDKTSGRRTHRPTQASKTRPHPTQAPMRGDNGRQKGETRRRKGGRTIQHRHTCGKTMGDNGLNGRDGETRLREGGHTIQHRHTCGETMGLMGEKGRQDLQDLGKANCKDSGSFTSASNSRQISIYSLQFTQTFSQCGVLSQQSVGSHSQISTIMECAVGQCMHLNTPP